MPIIGLIFGTEAGQWISIHRMMDRIIQDEKYHRLSLLRFFSDFCCCCFCHSLCSHEHCNGPWNNAFHPARKSQTGLIPTFTTWRPSHTTSSTQSAPKMRSIPSPTEINVPRQDALDSPPTTVSATPPAALLEPPEGLGFGL